LHPAGVGRENKSRWLPIEGDGLRFFEAIARLHPAVITAAYVFVFGGAAALFMYPNLWEISFSGVLELLAVGWAFGVWSIARKALGRPIKSIGLYLFILALAATLVLTAFIPFLSTTLVGVYALPVAVLSTFASFGAAASALADAGADNGRSDFGLKVGFFLGAFYLPIGVWFLRGPITKAAQRSSLAENFS
jgi:hypothetical protein